jgi:hypothetical protein
VSPSSSVSSFNSSVLVSRQIWTPSQVVRWPSSQPMSRSMSAAVKPATLVNSTRAPASVRPLPVRAIPKTGTCKLSALTVLGEMSVAVAGAGAAIARAAMNTPTTPAITAHLRRPPRVPMARCIVPNLRF